MALKESASLIGEGERPGRRPPDAPGATRAPDPLADRLTPVASIREVLTQHREKILIVPAGRRIPVAALLGHLDACQLESCPHEWATLACEVGFEESIDPAAVAAPWSDPEAPRCWRGARGPLFHLWVTGQDSEPRQLFGLIVPDQRAALHVTEIVRLLGEGETSAHEYRPDSRGAGRPFEAVLSELVVASTDSPSLPETDPRLTTLGQPEGEGWQGQWWKLRSRDQWQYGWWRWKEGG